MRKLLSTLYFLVPALWIGSSVAASPGGGAAAPVGGGAGGGGAEPMEGYHKIWEARLPITGESVSSPTLRWQSDQTYRVQVTGILDTRKLGAKYDAQFKSISAREFRVPHDHLRFSTPFWVSVYAHHQKHRYVYRLDPQGKKRPTLVRLSLDGIPYQFRISPARLKRESSSTLRVSLWKKGSTPRTKAPVRWQLAGLLAGLVFLAALIVWWARRRRANRAD